MSTSKDKLIASYELSKQSIMGVINPLEIIELFENSGLLYVLVGGHMLAYYTHNPRAIVDVDFIVSKGDYKKAVALIKENYPALMLNDKTQHITFDNKNVNIHAERINLIKDDFPLFKQVFKNLLQNEKKIKIPVIEAAIVLKFAACVSPNRAEDDKLIDQADLINLIRVESNLNNDVLLSLAETIYLGGGDELLQLIDNVRHNIIISL